MAKLAIKGHPTRGKEVIEILEMLGGKNTHDYICNIPDFAYSINKQGIIEWFMSRLNSPYTIFTLEEFLEKFPYKVGDKVSSKYLKNYKIKKMEWEDINNRVIYKLQGMGWYSANELQPYKEETMEKENKSVFDANAQCCDIMNHLIKEETMEKQITIDDITLEKAFMCTFLEMVEGKQRLRIALNEGFELKEENGKFFVYKKNIKYPKTYEECCKVLGVNPSFDIRMLEDKENTLCFNLIDLLRCRNAYWKIAGDWKLDFEKPCYCLYNEFGSIQKYEGTIDCNAILAFPTKEMRDTFFENFKDLIELVKELL